MNSLNHLNSFILHTSYSFCHCCFDDGVSVNTIVVHGCQINALTNALMR